MPCAPERDGAPFVFDQVGSACRPCGVLACGRSFFPYRLYSASLAPMSWAGIKLQDDGSILYCENRTLFQRAPGTGSVTIHVDPLCGTVTGEVPPDWIIENDRNIDFTCHPTDYLRPQFAALYSSLIIDDSDPPSFGLQHHEGREPICPRNPNGVGGGPFSFRLNAPGLAGCVVARATYNDIGEWSNLGGTVFFATKGVIFMWGRYRVDVFRTRRIGADGTAVLDGSLLSSNEYVAPPLDLDGSGNITWPQSFYTPVILEPAPQTEIVVYSLAT